MRRLIPLFLLFSAAFAQPSQDPADKEKPRLQKTSAMLKTCPDGHANLKDIPIRYGLFGIQIKQPRDWTDEDRNLAQQRDSHEVILGTDALAGGEPDFQPTCLTCGYHYRIRSVPDVDGEWVKEGGKFSDFKTTFSSVTLSLPFASMPGSNIRVGVKDSRVVSEAVSVTIPLNQRDEMISKLERWIDEHHYQRLLLQVDLPLEPDLAGSLSSSPKAGHQTVEEGNAEFKITVTTMDSVVGFNFSLDRKQLPKN